MKKFLLNNKSFDIINQLRIVNRNRHDIVNQFEQQDDIISWKRALSEDEIIHLYYDHSRSMIDCITTILDKNSAKKSIRQLFGLKNNKTHNMKIENLLNKNQLKKISPYSHINVPQFASPFEGLTYIIFGQQISVNIADKQRTMFIRTFGRRFTNNNHDYYLYPLPSDVIGKNLSTMSLSRTKQKAIQQVSEYCFKNIDYQKSDLLALHGVGTWTVDWFLLRNQFRTDIIPAGDLQVRKAISWFFGEPSLLSANEVKKMEEKFHPVGGLITMRLLLAFDDYLGENK